MHRDIQLLADGRAVPRRVEAFIDYLTGTEQESPA